ncbi:beta-ketoacyl-ACP synthase [Rhizobium deserti]|uniref:Beta-ketoacyl-ACP synthase n=1 Tax=Rhizobium deserti TaxID=2547961 RepID=A0A4R5UMV7_9HYPH|nr:beta-ketoacyl-ACP synthase [Rhizobium deserti]TDK39225.1 beta-ketoacyl-ACP synthase [Rhizobium deserti]
MGSIYNDDQGRPLVAVTGMGLITSLGQGLEENWAAACEGRSGISPITRFPTDFLRTRIAGTVDFVPLPAFNPVERGFALARETVAEALGASGLRADFGGPLFLAASPVEPEWEARFALADRSPPVAEGATAYDRFLAAMRERRDPIFHDAAAFGTVAERLADKFGTRGLPVTVSTACASGATAIQLAVEAIRQGRADRALAVATEGSITAEALIRFQLLSALSTQNGDPARASKPFSCERDGFVMAEGAAALVLEPLARAASRGAKIFGYVRGCADKADAFHRTRSSPDGIPAVETMRAALADAGLHPDEIGYVNAHGTSTPENDKMEYGATSAVFGGRLADLPVSSNKSMIGHTISAAGAIEAVFSLLSVGRNTLLPTINYDRPDPAIPLDVVPNVRRSMEVRHVLSNSFGFGGQNASLVLSRADQVPGGPT